MVCSADDLVAWRDFPKGLRVLLLDQDAASAAQTKLKLEAMDYIVFSFCNENEAMEAISMKTQSFHVALVEVIPASSHASFRFLETVKDLPIVAISDAHCLSTMMKCIALGAAEFLQKPLSEEKLRNIWQHVVHKAFNAGGNDLSNSLQPIKETVVSMLQLQPVTAKLKIQLPTEVENAEKDQENKHDNSEENDKLSAPSTPQLVKGGRLMDDRLSQEAQDPPVCLREGESLDCAMDLIERRETSHSMSKFVDNTANNVANIAVNSSKEVQISEYTENAAEEEVTSDNGSDGSKNDQCSSVKGTHQQHNADNMESKVEDHKKKKSSLRAIAPGNKSNKRKMKVDWTSELHRKFVQAVERLGFDQAIPSKILELMKVEGLTRHNVASHLQKYRMHKRHILPKDNTKWQPQRGYMQNPLMVLPPFNSSCQVYPLWPHPSYCPPGAQAWGPTGFPAWHPIQGTWNWKTHSGTYAEAWGCPVVPPYNQYAMPSQNTVLNNAWDANGGSNPTSQVSYDFNVAEEVVDEVMKEAISKPWLPLPLGLKPPSIDGVLAELQRQGIRTIPPVPRG